MDHAALVKLAVRWLEAMPCAVTIAESGVRGEEHPDAIGWTPLGTSVLIECKATRKDFLAEWTRTDRKPFRRLASLGMGQSRYYLCPRKVIDPKELMGGGWGLLEVCSGKVLVSMPSGQHKANREAEVKLLVSSFSKVKSGKDVQQLRLEFASGW